MLAEIEDLEAQSEALAARIRAAQQQSSSSTAPGRLRQRPALMAGLRARHERLRRALGPDARGHRHRRRDQGTPVHAAAGGTVIYAGWMEGYGNLVVIDHGNGLSTAYGHNSSLASSVGQSVSAGQVIAYSGSTGHSTGPHVHFEVTGERRARRPARLPLSDVELDTIASSHRPPHPMKRCGARGDLDSAPIPTGGPPQFAPAARRAQACARPPAPLRREAQHDRDRSAGDHLHLGSRPRGPVDVHQPSDRGDPRVHARTVGLRPGPVGAPAPP